MHLHLHEETQQIIPNSVLNELPKLKIGHVLNLKHDHKGAELRVKLPTLLFIAYKHVCSLCINARICFEAVALFFFFSPQPSIG